MKCFTRCNPRRCPRTVPAASSCARLCGARTSMRPNRPLPGWLEQMSQTIFKSTPEQAAEAAAAALAEGMSPSDIGEAITLAANQLVLCDLGRTPRDEVSGKPVGSVHGDSIGVHACDSANA